jgi:hypothetical protein
MQLLWQHKIKQQDKKELELLINMLRNKLRTMLVIDNGLQETTDQIGLKYRVQIQTEAFLMVLLMMLLQLSPSKKLIWLNPMLL